MVKQQKFMNYWLKIQNLNKTTIITKQKKQIREKDKEKKRLNKIYSRKNGNIMGRYIVLNKKWRKQRDSTNRKKREIKEKNKK